MNASIITWGGEENRPLAAHRPCDCGCDTRDGEKGVGYITYSDSEGRGFTVWIEDEDTYAYVERSLA